MLNSVCDATGFERSVGGKWDGGDEGAQASAFTLSFSSHPETLDTSAKARRHHRADEQHVFWKLEQGSTLQTFASYRHVHLYNTIAKSIALYHIKTPDIESAYNLLFKLLLSSLRNSTELSAYGSTVTLFSGFNSPAR